MTTGTAVATTSGSTSGAGANPGAGADTRMRLIEVAVEHFAEHGFAAASQRAIQRDAGVNPAAAHYHFGSKEAMYRAVIDTFVHDVQEERLRRHEAIPADLAGHARLERLLFDYFTPGIAVAETPSGYHYARMLARVQGERPTAPTITIWDEIVGPIRNRYLDSLQQLFPDAPRDQLAEVLATGVMIMATTAAGPRHRNLATPGGAAREAERVARFVGAGFEALFGPAH